MSRTFAALVTAIADADRTAVHAAGRQVQKLLSLRAWLIGAWIVAFEQHGEGRASYGDRLIDRLADALKHTGRKGLSARNLINYRQVAVAYPGLDVSRLHGTTSGLGGLPEIPQTSAESPQASVPELPWRDVGWLHRLFTELTFSHLLELARVDDLLERGFYELHALQEGWSVRELVRQRNTLLYQRVGLSSHRDEVVARARAGVIDERPESVLRDPYVLEFLGLRETPELMEADLEQALIDNLQRFMLELGREFCFVDRQFRITVGNRHHHLDLLFFHRRLRCLVAIDLKIGEFLPDHVGQMGFYLNYLAENATLPGENPPIGLLLCSSKDAEVVRYATGTADDVFVSRYLLALPTEDRLRQWLHQARALSEEQIRQTASIHSTNASAIVTPDSSAKEPL